MTSILFLDDDPERHDYASVLYPDCVHVYDVASCITALDYQHWDEVHLDHDLADYGPTDMYGYKHEYTGVDVARHIAKMEKPPSIVYVHSWNPDGAKLMCSILKDAGVCAFMAPFMFND